MGPRRFSRGCVARRGLRRSRSLGASMGPRRFSRGCDEAWDEARFKEKLQWGRDVLVADVFAAAVCPRRSKRLAWSAARITRGESLDRTLYPSRDGPDRTEENSTPAGSKSRRLRAPFWPRMASFPPRLLRPSLPRRSFSVARIQQIEAEVKHDVIAFTTAVAETLKNRASSPVPLASLRPYVQRYR